ncbi:MAG: chromate transporter [Polaromonas sp.]|jgi:chromate transporter|nr:chromate transporter [Polaromonas sp.]
MSETLSLHFGVTEWFQFFLHYLSLSLMAIGGAIAMIPDMHRFLVDQNLWLTDAQFNASVAIAQAAPGPNVLFIALMGWNVGMNAGGILSGLLGIMLAMAGMLIPSSVLTYNATQWGHRNRNLRSVRAFKQGMAPIVVALLISTGLILTSASGESLDHWPLWLLTAVTAVICWRTKLHILWLLGAGALLGWFGWV